MEKVREFTDRNFVEEVLSNHRLVLVDFTGEWCIACRKITPILREIATEYDGVLQVGEVDVDKCPELAMRYGVRSVPSMLIFDKGKVVDQVIGAVTKQALVRVVQAALIP